MNGAYLGRAPSAGTGWENFKTDADMIDAFCTRSHPNGRRGQSRMSFNRDRFLSYWTTIARWCHCNGRSAVVVDMDNFDSSFTPGHRGVLISGLEANRVPFFKIIRGRRGQDMNVARSPYWVAEFALLNHQIIGVPRNGPGGGALRKSTIAGHLMFHVGMIDEGIKMCRFFGVSDRRLRIERENHADEIVSAAKVLLEYAMKYRARRWDGDERVSQAEEVLECEKKWYERVIADAKARAESYRHGFFGTGFWMLDGAPHLVDRVEATLAKRHSKMMRIRFERMMKRNDIKKEEWLMEMLDLRKLLVAAEAEALELKSMKAKICPPIPAEHRVIEPR